MFNQFWNKNSSVSNASVTTTSSALKILRRVAPNSDAIAAAWQSAGKLDIDLMIAAAKVGNIDLLEHIIEQINDPKKQSSDIIRAIESLGDYIRQKSFYALEFNDQNQTMLALLKKLDLASCGGMSNGLSLLAFCASLPGSENIVQHFCQFPGMNMEYANRGVQASVVLHLYKQLYEMLQQENPNKAYIDTILQNIDLILTVQLDSNKPLNSQLWHEMDFLAYAVHEKLLELSKAPANAELGELEDIRTNSVISNINLMLMQLKLFGNQPKQLAIDGKFYYLNIFGVAARNPNMNNIFQTLLHATKKEGDYKKELLKIYEAEDNNVYSANAIIGLVQANNIEHLAKLIEQYKFSAAELKLNDSTGRNALWYAYFNGNTDIVGLLETCKLSKPLEGSIKHGYTFLMAACYSGRLELVEKSLEHTNVRAKDPKRQTALHYLCAIKKEEGKNEEEIYNIFNLLMEGNAKINTPDQDGHTPLMIAAQNKNICCVRKLVACGAMLDINYQDKSGKTALMHAVESGNFEIIKTLLNDPRIDTRIKDNKGLDAFSMLLLLNTSIKDQESVVQDEGNVILPIPSLASSSATSRLKKMYYAVSGWMKSFFTGQTNVAIDGVFLDDNKIAVLRLFLDRGADPGITYMQDIQDLGAALVVPTIMHYGANILMRATKIMPRGVASLVASYFNSRYFVKPAVEGIVQKIAAKLAGTDMNYDRVFKGTQLGIYHINWLGIVKHKPFDNQTAPPNPLLTDKIKIYKMVIARYIAIERDLYSFSYDGKYLNFFMKLITAHFRNKKLTLLQSELQKYITPLLNVINHNGENISMSPEMTTRFKRYIEYCLAHPDELEKVSKNQNAQKVIDRIVMCEAMVRPDLYSSVLKLDEAIKTRQYARVLGVIEYIILEVKQLFYSVLYKPNLKPSINFDEIYNVVNDIEVDNDLMEEIEEDIALEAGQCDNKVATLMKKININPSWVAWFSGNIASAGYVAASNISVVQGIAAGVCLAAIPVFSCIAVIAAGAGAYALYNRMPTTMPEDKDVKVYNDIVENIKNLRQAQRVQKTQTLSIT